MSTVRVEQLKAYLRVSHDADDALLQELINGAESEALQFLDRPTLPRSGASVVDECDSNQPEPISDSDDLDPVVRMGIYLIAQGMYEGKDATDMAAVRQAAVVKWFPFRNNLGV